MNLEKVNIIFDWILLIFFYYIRSFLEFYKFYQYFIQEFSKLAELFTSLIKKDIFFN